MTRASVVRCVALVAAGWLAGCATAPPVVRLTEDWPATIREYDAVVGDWTRRSELHIEFQEVCELAATLKSAEWRAAHAQRDAAIRGLTAEAREQQFAQSRADVAGPYELEVMLTTWDRRENDLDRGKKSVWRVVLIDEAGAEIEPLEIIKDRRPTQVVRAEFPSLGEFATPYVARFPRSKLLFGPAAKQVRLRISSTRGGLELAWKAI
jgi:hypothetical protein